MSVFMKNNLHLEIHNIDFSYAESHWRLSVDFFSLKQGEITTIIGANGSGKSTFLKIAAGLMPPEAGEVYLGNESLYLMERKHIARFVGYLPQNVMYQFDLRVVDVVSKGRYPHQSATGFLRERDIQKVEDCMKQTETLAFRKRPLSRLSGGERQLVFLASVLAQEPLFLLLDEPTTALDLHHQVLLFNLLRELVQEGMGVLVVTHDINLASQFSDRMCLFQQGQLTHTGTPEDLLTPHLLQQIYGDCVSLIAHPQTGRPMLFPNVKGVGS